MQIPGINAGRVSLSRNSSGPRLNPEANSTDPSSSDRFTPTSLPSRSPSPALATETRPQVSLPLGKWNTARSVIFGSQGSQVPAEISDVVCPPILSPAPFPSQRWVVTPRIEANHRQQVETLAPEELRDGPKSELATLIAPLLERRYGHREGLTVAELGPATSTTVAATLSDSSHRYVAVEMSEPYLEKQLDFLRSDTESRCFGVKGDTYNLPLVPGQTDLVVVSCHPPFVSSTPADRLEAFQEVHQALKPGGEFLLFPYREDQQPEEVQNFLRQNFEVMEKASSPLGADRQAWVFRKKA